MLDADFTTSEVISEERRCKGCAARGAVPPPAWEREGVGKGLEKTRFFRVSSQGNPASDGTYCEPCIVVARAFSRTTKSDQRR